MTKLSWKLLHRLEKKYGESFYILDSQKFVSNYQEFLRSFRSFYPKSNIAYSYKTNYIPRICQLSHTMGGYAEVVSRMEYDLARRIGVPASKIIFNGPLKLPEDIKLAVLSGSMVNLDSSYEIQIIESIAQQFPEHEIAVGIRCNFDIGLSSTSRFGFDVENGEIEQMFQRFDRLANCQVQGLHCHFSSQRSVESYISRTQKMLELSAKYFKSAYPKFIDLGGGFFSKMSKALQTQFDHVIPDYTNYAEAIASQFASAFPQSLGPELILEPGISIVADTLKFVAKVIDKKVVRSHQFALTTGSIHNIKPTLNNKNLPMQVYRENLTLSENNTKNTVDVVGYTCMEHDYLYKGFHDSIDVGDYIVFDNVGAYTIVLKPPFIRPGPAIIEYDSISGKYKLIKSQEKFEDVFSTYDSFKRRETRD